MGIEPRSTGRVAGALFNLIYEVGGSYLGSFSNISKNLLIDTVYG